MFLTESKIVFLWDLFIPGYLTELRLKLLGTEIVKNFEKKPSIWMKYIDDIFIILESWFTIFG